MKALCVCALALVFAVAAPGSASAAPTSCVSRIPQVTPYSYTVTQSGVKDVFDDLGKFVRVDNYDGTLTDTQRSPLNEVAEAFQVSIGDAVAWFTACDGKWPYPDHRTWTGTSGPWRVRHTLAVANGIVTKHEEFVSTAPVAEPCVSDPCGFDRAQATKTFTYNVTTGEFRIQRWLARHFVHSEPGFISYHNVKTNQQVVGTWATTTGTHAAPKLPTLESDCFLYAPQAGFSYEITQSGTKAVFDGSGRYVRTDSYEGQSPQEVVNPLTTVQDYLGLTVVEAERQFVRCGSRWPQPRFNVQTFQSGPWLYRIETTVADGVISHVVEAMNVAAVAPPCTTSGCVYDRAEFSSYVRYNIATGEVSAEDWLNRRFGELGIPEIAYHVVSTDETNTGAIPLSITPVPGVVLIDATIDPRSVVGGSSSPRGAVLRLLLSGPAPPGGLTVDLSGQVAKWPEAANYLSPPDVIRIPERVLINEGSASLDVPIETDEVTFPVPVTIRIASASVILGRELVVLPPPIPGSGPTAAARVKAILEHFQFGSSLADFKRAFSAIVEVRNMSAEGKADVYMAAADHYLFAAIWVLEHPSHFYLVQGFVPAYELVKLIDFGGWIGGSAPTRLSVIWGLQGTVDALKLAFGDDVVRLTGPHFIE